MENQENQTITVAGDPIALQVEATSNGQRVTPQSVEANILSEHYFTAADGQTGVDCGYVPEHQPGSLKLLTFCVLVLRNGFTVTGQSACADPANFNAEIGRQIARQDATRQVWAFLGYELRTILTRQGRG